MRQRITFLHKPEDAIDPKSIQVANDSLAFSGLKAAREDRITFGIDELPSDVAIALKQSHELHIRFINRIFYESVSPLLSRAAPGLHVYHTPQRGSDSDLLCLLLHKVFSPVSENLCQTPEKSFTSLPAQRFHHTTAYEYYLPQSHYNRHALVDYLLQSCPQSDKSCRQRVESLRTADYIDIDFDTISHALNIISFWASQTWGLTVLSIGPKDRLEVGILSNETPLEPEELNLGGFLTVVGEDVKPSPALFSFPARHHSSTSSFFASFLLPTGLHPSLQLQISDATRPSGDRTCSLHAHLTLPRVIFADRYQLSNPLLLASKNISKIHYITSPVDLEAPEYAMDLWGSTLLLELSPPKSATPKSKSWTAEVPLHLRYLPPSLDGYSDVAIPYPVLFWACTAEEGSKYTINPFDRVNLGWDGLFGPRTMFYHLSPGKATAAPGAPPGAAAGNEAGSKLAGLGEGYLIISVPVLKEGYDEVIEIVTTLVIFLGFAWVMWKLFEVWRREGYGRVKSTEPVKEGKKTR